MLLNPPTLERQGGYFIMRELVQRKWCGFEHQPHNLLDNFGQNQYPLPQEVWRRWRMKVIGGYSFWNVKCFAQ